MRTNKTSRRMHDYPKALQQLAEPLRGKAIEAAEEMMDEGMAPEEAYARAVEQALEYKATRAPHSPDQDDA